MNGHEKPFTVKALNERFELVALVVYSNLQWDRKFHQPGQFILELDAGQYTNEWRYIYTEQRPELGEISQVNFKKENNGRKTVTLSGLFMEKELNKMICYPMPSAFDDDPGTHYGTSILKTGSPLWLSQDSTADQVARAFFEGFKKISFRNYAVGDNSEIQTSTFELPITYGTTAPGEYKRAIHTRNGEQLGAKVYDILNESNASYRIPLDYDTGTLSFNIIHGINRTESQQDENINPVVLSTKNGTIKEASFVKSNTDTKDVMIQYSQSDEQTLVLANAKPGAIGRIMATTMSANQGDYIKEDTPDKAAADREHKTAVMADAMVKLYEKRDKINIEVDIDTGSYRYMEDFDLGDIVQLEIPEIGISADAEIAEVHEVMKNGTWSISLTVGTPIIRKRGI